MAKWSSRLFYDHGVSLRTFRHLIILSWLWRCSYQFTWFYEHTSRFRHIWYRLRLFMLLNLRLSFLMLGYKMHKFLFITEINFRRLENALFWVGLLNLSSILHLNRRSKRMFVRFWCVLVLYFELAFKHLMNHFGLFLLVCSEVSRGLNFFDFKAIDLLILFNFFATIFFFVRYVYILTAFYFDFNDLSWLSIPFDTNFWVNLFKVEFCLWWCFAWRKQVNADIFCFGIKLLVKSLLIDWHSYLLLSTCVMLSRGIRRSWTLILFVLSNLP